MYPPVMEEQSSRRPMDGRRAGLAGVFNYDLAGTRNRVMPDVSELSVALLYESIADHPGHRFTPVSIFMRAVRSTRRTRVPINSALLDG